MEINLSKQPVYTNKFGVKDLPDFRFLRPDGTEVAQVGAPQLTAKPGPAGFAAILGGVLETWWKEAGAKGVAWLHDPARAWSTASAKRPLAVLFYAEPAAEAGADAQPAGGPNAELWRDAGVVEAARGVVALAWPGAEFEGISVKPEERPALVVFGSDKKELARAVKLDGPEAAKKLLGEAAKSAVAAAEEAAKSAGRAAQLEEFKKALAQPAEADKLKALATMGASKNPGAVPLLAEALKNSQWKVREGAAQALGALGLPAGGPALVEILKNKKEVGEVAAAAATALGAIGDKAAVPALVADLMSVKEDKPYFARIDALGKIKDPSAISALVELTTSIKGKPIKETLARILKLLEALTGQKHPDAKAWRDWWSKSQEGFQFPKAAEAGKAEPGAAEAGKKEAGKADGGKPEAGK